jgi:hypothetical protein
MKTCGECKWFVIQRGAYFGTCDYTLPFWADPDGKEDITEKNDQAEFCACFEKKED